MNLYTSGSEGCGAVRTISIQDQDCNSTFIYESLKAYCNYFMRYFQKTSFKFSFSKNFEKFSSYQALKNLEIAYFKFWPKNYLIGHLQGNLAGYIFCMISTADSLFQYREKTALATFIRYTLWSRRWPIFSIFKMYWQENSFSPVWNAKVCLISALIALN